MREFLDYNAATGELIWKRREKAGNGWNTRFAGKVAGFPDCDGYIVFGYGGKLLKAHRVIWEMHKGPIPSGLKIDHRNRIRSDNRLSNLRLATHLQNCANATANKRALPRGVVFSDGAFQAAITVNRKYKYLGRFQTPELAGEVYELAAEMYHGDFYYKANHHAN